MQALSGRVPVEEAIKEVERVIESLPKVANAQQRLLGIQMGADVRALDGETRSVSSGEAAQQPDDWVPKVGEQVLVCLPCSVRSLAFLTLLPQLQSTHQSACLLYTSPSPRDREKSRMPSSA